VIGMDDAMQCGVTSIGCHVGRGFTGCGINAFSGLQGIGSILRKRAVLSRP